MKLKAKLDAVFSKYIRKRYANSYGIVQCVTCGKTHRWEYMQCGHYFSRNVGSLRYDERNCQVQCPECNMMKCGNIQLYTNYIKATYGDEVLAELGHLSNQHSRLRDPDYIELIELYKKKLKELG